MLCKISNLVSILQFFALAAGLYLLRSSNIGLTHHLIILSATLNVNSLEQLVSALLLLAELGQLIVHVLCTDECWVSTTLLLLDQSVELASTRGKQTSLIFSGASGPRGTAIDVGQL